MIEKYQKKADSEQILLILVTGISVYMFVESFTFHPDAANFPQIMSSSVILFGVLLLLKNYLPEGVQKYLMQEQTIDVGSVGDDEVQEDLKETGEKPKGSAETLDRPIHPSLFTTIITILYLVSSYLFGLFWMTPIVVIGYLVWFKQPWWKIGVVTAVSIIAVYGFIELLNMGFFSGAL